jgi:hypothetical protein
MGDMLADILEHHLMLVRYRTTERGESRARSDRYENFGNDDHNNLLLPTPRRCNACEKGCIWCIVPDRDLIVSVGVHNRSSQHLYVPARSCAPVNSKLYRPHVSLAIINLRDD